VLLYRGGREDPRGAGWCVTTLFFFEMDHHVRDRDLEDLDERVWMVGRKERERGSKCWRKLGRRGVGTLGNEASTNSQHV
jgi:hypothetical protein